ncbi:uncharacterized protein PHACADRAFT_250976, partial [Phanerochaete carnosa HHB-10118-sp]
MGDSNTLSRRRRLSLLVRLSSKPHSPLASQGASPVCAALPILSTAHRRRFNTVDYSLPTDIVVATSSQQWEPSKMTVPEPELENLPDALSFFFSPALRQLPAHAPFTNLRMATSRF